MTEKIVLSPTVAPLLGTQANTTSIPCTARKDEFDEDSQGLSGICIDHQVINSEHLCIDLKLFIPVFEL